ncbi:UNVERIFIED_CONTAM: hypothetical protein Cloal_0173 [Acetivibrio alkalicellulosi]
MKKNITKLNIFLIIIIIIMSFIISNCCLKFNDYPSLHIEFWNTGLHSLVDPLLTEYHWTKNNRVKSFYEPQRKINRYLENEDNILYIRGIGILRLDFFEKNVYEVSATINGTEADVRLTDGIFYIDFEETSGTKLFEITSRTSSYTTAKYVFRAEFTEDKEYKDLFYQKLLDEIQKQYTLSENEIINLSGWESIVPYTGDTGTVFKISMKGSNSSHKVFAVDQHTMKVYERDIRGQYRPINQ